MLEITLAPAKQNKSVPANITDRIKTMEDVYAALGITGNVLHAKLDDNLKDEADAISAFVQLKLLAKVLNEGWKPDWKNGDEYKYYPWFDLEKGFVLGSVLSCYTNTTATSRLCFKTRELAEYAGTQFIELWKLYMVIDS